MSCALAERGQDLFGNQLQVGVQILARAGVGDYHGAGAGGHVLVEPLDAVLGRAEQQVASSLLRKILRVVTSHLARRHLARPVAIAIHRSEDEQAVAESTSLATQLADNFTNT